MPLPLAIDGRIIQTEQYSTTSVRVRLAFLYVLLVNHHDHKPNLRKSYDLNMSFNVKLIKIT